MQTLAAVPLYVPAGQLVAAELPATQNVPATQLPHDAMFLSPELAVPAAHGVGATIPVDGQ